MPPWTQPLAVHSLADARFAQQLGRPLLEHAGADPRLDVLTAARLEHDRVDAVALQQLAEQQTGRTGTDDRHLRALGTHCRRRIFDRRGRTASVWLGE